MEPVLQIVHNTISEIFKVVIVKVVVNMDAYHALTQLHVHLALMDTY